MLFSSKGSLKVRGFASKFWVVRFSGLVDTIFKVHCWVFRALGWLHLFLRGFVLKGFQGCPGVPAFLLEGCLGVSGLGSRVPSQTPQTQKGVLLINLI